MKLLRRSAIILCFCFGFLFILINKSINIFAETNPYTKPNLNNDYYEITNKSNLDWFRFEVNTNKKYTINAKLMNDIDYNNESYEPIGLNSTRYFGGIFDGNNHTIKNVLIDNTEYTNYGIFGYVKNTTIKTLTVSSSTIIVNKTYGGAIVGYLYNSTIENCLVSSDVEIKNTDDNTNSLKLGGITGFMSTNSKVDSCISYASINYTSTSKSSNIGGICGEGNGIITDCTNSGNIITDVEIYAGGICGNSSGTLTNNNNNGNIKSKVNAGGICAYADSNSIIENNRNNGMVESEYSGGIASRVVAGIVRNNINYGNIKGTSPAGIVSRLINSKVTLTNCDNHGTIEGSYTASGIVFENKSTLILYCNNYGEIISQDIAAGICISSRNDIRYCVNEGHIKGANIAAGICSHLHTNVFKSYSLGEVEAQYNNGYAAGIIYKLYDTDNKNLKIDSCYFFGNIKGTYINPICNSLSGDIYNCYAIKNNKYTYDYLNYDYMIKEVDVSDIESGMVCYSLNKEGTEFRQNIGTDSHPTLDSNKDIVYLECNNGVVNYYNEEKEIEHKFINGICECGEYEKPEIANDGTYLIKNIGNLYYFSILVNQGNNEINAKLLNDIYDNENVSNKFTVSEYKITNRNTNNLREWLPIGNTKYPYNGKFDGCFYSINGLYSESFVKDCGLFGSIGENSIVKNLDINDVVFLPNSEYSYDRAYPYGILCGTNEGNIDLINFTNTYIGLGEELLITHESDKPIYGYNLDHEDTNYILMYITGFYEMAKVSEAYQALIPNAPATIKYLFIEYNYIGHGTIRGIQYFYQFPNIININEGITHINDGAFYQIKTITSVNLPESLVYIGDFVFEENQMRIMHLPSNLKHLGNLAFRYCYYLGYINIPESLTELDSSALSLSSIKYITVDYDEETFKNRFPDLYNNSNYVFTYNIGENKVQLNIDFNYEELSNPCMGMYIRLVSLSDSILIPITNKKNYIIPINKNELYYAEIVNNKELTYKELGNIISNENIKKEYELEKATSFEFKLLDENNNIISDGYKLVVYNNGLLYDTYLPTNGKVNILGLPISEYVIDIEYEYDLTIKYQKCDVIKLNYEGNYNDSITLNPLTEKTYSGTIKKDNEALPNFEFKILKTYGKYNIYENLITDNDGKFSINSNTKTYIIAKLDDCYDINEELTTGNNKVYKFEEIGGIKINFTVLTQSASKITNYINTDFDFEISNLNTGEIITNYYYNYPYLYLFDNNIGDNIKIRVFNVKGYSEESDSITLSDYNNISIKLYEYGFVYAKNVNGYINILDSNGIRVTSFDGEYESRSETLMPGNYKIIISDKSVGYFLNSLAAISKYNLVLNQDYYSYDISLGLNEVYKLENININDINMNNNYINHNNTGLRIDNYDLIINHSTKITLDIDFLTGFDGGLLHIYLPDNVIYVNKSFTIDGKLKDVTYKDNEITSSIYESTEKVTFNFYAISASNIIINYVFEHNNKFEYIDSISLNVGNYKFDTKNNNDGTVNVYGFTFSNTKIEIYDNDNLCDTINSSSFGYFSTDIKIDTRYNDHNIYLKIYNGNEVIKTNSSSITLITDNVTEFYMVMINDNSGGEKVSDELYKSDKYKGVNFYKVKYDLLSADFKSYGFCDAFPTITFYAKFDTHHSAVFVYYKAKNGFENTLELEYDEENDIWFGSYDFTEYNTPSSFKIGYQAEETSIINILSKEITVGDGADLIYENNKETTSEFNLYPSLVTNGLVTFRINGYVINHNTEIKIDLGTSTLNPIRTYWINGSEVYAQFDLSKVKNGKYNLLVNTEKLEFTVDNTLNYGTMSYSINVTDKGNINDEYIGNIKVYNKGYSDVYAKIFIIKLEDMVFTDGEYLKYVFVESDKGLAGTILANEMTGYNFKYRITGNNPKVYVIPFESTGLSILNINDYTNALSSNLVNLVGDTLDNIALMANYLSSIGNKNITLEMLDLAFTNKANSSYGSSVLLCESIINKHNFVLTRSYLRNVADFNAIGMFGHGFITEFEASIDVFDNYIIMNFKDGPVALIKNGDKYLSANGQYSGVIKDNKFIISFNNYIYYFNLNNKLSEVYYKNSRIHEIKYDSNNRIIEITGLSDTVNFEYNSNNLVEKVYLNSVLYETYTYSVNYLMSVRGTVNYSYEYQAINGRTILKRAIVGEDFVNFTFDNNYRLTSANMNGLTTKYEYDDGLGVKVINGDEITYLYFNYDGTLARRIYPNGVDISIYFDDDTYIVSSSGRETKYDLENNRIRTIIDYMGNITHYEYYDNGKLKAIIDSNDNRTEYSYDSNGNLTEVRYPDSTIETFSYDDNNRITKMIERNGNCITYTYNGNFYRKMYSDGSYENYDLDGNKLTITTDDSSLFELVYYNEAGLVSKVSYPDAQDILFGYDDKNRLSSITDIFKKAYAYEYDSFNNITRIKYNNTTIRDYTYDNQGRLIKEKSGSITTEYEYIGGQIKSIITKKNSTVLSKYIYTYNSMGLIDSLETIDNLYAYGYDYNGRIISIVSNTDSIEISYDGLGNRLWHKLNGNLVEYETNSMNQYTKIGSANLEYDLNGNLIKYQDGNDIRTFEYDFKNQLIELKNNDDIYEYKYDLFGNKSEIIINGVSTKYYYTPNQNGTLISSSGETKLSYINSFKIEGYMNNTTSTVTPYFYDADSLGNVYNVFDKNGNTKNQYTYDLLGELTSLNETIVQPFKYAGTKGVMTDGSGYYYAAIRHIQPETMSFISPDINSYDYGMNLYQYGCSNYVNLYDENGEVAATGTAIAVGAAAGAITSVAGQFMGDLATGFKNASVGAYTGALVGGAVGGAIGGVVVLYTAGTAATVWSSVAGGIGSGVGSLVTDLVDGAYSNKPYDWGKIGRNVAFNTTVGTLTGFLPSNYGIGDAVKMKYPGASGFLFDVGADVADQSAGNVIATTVSLWIGLIWDELFGEKKVNPLLDPSGYVCEAVKSNLLTDVKCTIYYSEFSDGRNKIKWDAESFNQFNPLYTDNNGYYSWIVPEGYWQVEYEKDGYLLAKSDWLRVPPIQLDVNVGLISYNSPEVDEIYIDNNEIYIQFSQYMNLDTINNDNITFMNNGNRINGSLIAVNSESSFEDDNIKYASLFKFVPSEAVEGTLNIKINNVYNYADTPISDEYNLSINMDGSIIPGDNPSENPVEPESGNNDSNGSNVGLIVGLSVGGVLIALALVGAVIIIKKRKSA